MANYVCDLCGWQSEDPDAILSHMRDEHQVEDAAPWAAWSKTTAF